MVPTAPRPAAARCGSRALSSGTPTRSWPNLPMPKSAQHRRCQSQTALAAHHALRRFYRTPQHHRPRPSGAQYPQPTARRACASCAQTHRQGPRGRVRRTAATPMCETSTPHQQERPPHRPWPSLWAVKSQPSKHRRRRCTQTLALSPLLRGRRHLPRAPRARRLVQLWLHQCWQSFLGLESGQRALHHRAHRSASQDPACQPG